MTLEQVSVMAESLLYEIIENDPSHIENIPEIQKLRKTQIYMFTQNLLEIYEQGRANGLEEAARIITKSTKSIAEDIRSRKKA